MRKPFEWLAAHSVEKRWSVVLAILAISGLSLVGHFQPEFFSVQLWGDDSQDSSGSKTQARDVDPEPNVSPISLSNSDAVLVVQADEFFTPEAAEALRAVAEQVEGLDQVNSLLWLDRVPVLNIFGLPEPLLPSEKASATKFALAREKALLHPLVGGQLLSADGKTMLMMVRFDYYHIFNDADATVEIRETAERAAAQYPDVGLRFQITGRVPSAVAAIAMHEKNQVKYQLFGYGMVLLMSLILFRGIRAVLIVAMAPILGVFWTLGFIRFFDYNDNPLVDVILPVLISLVGLTDGVHLMVQIRKLRAQGNSYKEAASEGLKRVGIACFLTSLTTAIGFGSLMLADSQWVQQFGLCSMIGVLLSFIAVVTIIPLACASKLGSGIEAGLQRSLVDRNLNRVSGVIDWVLPRRAAVGAMAVGLTVVLVLCSMQLRPDQRLSDGLPQSAEATVALRHLDTAFGGLEFSQVVIEWTRSVDADSPEILQVVSAVDDFLRGEELIGHPLSIRNLIDAQPGSGPPEERMSLMELLPPPLKRAFFSPEQRRAVVSFRVRDLGIAAYGEVFQRLEERIEAIQQDHVEFQLELDGQAVWRWRNLYQIVVDLAYSLGTATAIIWIVLTVVFRSIRLGLISLVPNLFPLALTGTYLYFAGYNLEIVMVCNFTVCLGVAVDDTIHFMTRYLDCRDGARNNTEAIQRAFTGVGTALIMTTAVLVAGFGVVTFSDSRDHHIFATMGALTVAAALFCDLVFLPALLSLWAPRQTQSQQLLDDSPKD